MSFVGLHVHTDYSLLDGASQIPKLIDKAIELGMPAIALTDHGVMYGAIELIKVCRGKGIKPIIGNEMYVINEPLDTTARCRRYHQVVLAKNTKGYKNLVKLTTISSLEGIHGKGIFARPCINKELLEQYHEGLIVTSACLGGEIPQAILQNKLDVARKVAKWYKKLFGDDYYLELQDHGSQEDRIVNVELVKIARELNIKLIATNDSHFISCYDVEAHDALLCIQTGKLISEDKRMRYSGTEYMKSAEEMALLFRDHLSDEVIQEAIANTLEVASKIETYHILGEPRIPDFQCPPGETPNTYVEWIAKEGLKERFKYKSYEEIPQVYRDRLVYEVEMLQKMGFAAYFLVVWDYIKYARDRGIPVGPGRGSAAGSLVAYAMQITNIDPVHHGLLFERFLNPERKSMPDIDTDFCISRRDEVIQYVTEKYGKDRVAQIITFNRLTSKAVLKDVARVLGVPYKKSDEMAKLIPVSRGKPEKLSVMISDKSPAPEFREAYVKNEQILREDGTIVKFQQWLDMALRIEGTNKSSGVHAAGVVISADPLDEIVPLQKNNDGATITQYPMEDLESLGLLKMDFLGLKNLTMIQKTLDYIKETKNLDFDPYQFPSDERRAQEVMARGTVKKLPKDIEKTYKILERGDLEGVFQLESSGMKQIVQDLKPSSIEDISSILALYRPGPLDAGLIPKFIDRKHGREAIQYEHPLLEGILQETYAVMVYQEQIMKIAQDLGGYSLGQADLLRRAMGKKKPEEMNKHRELFLDGATKNGVSKSIAEKLFNQMLLFAEYCFNKSHSTAYGYVTYQTAYLKANYPVEYMAALLTSNSGDQDKVQKYIANCQELNITVQGPDINRSGVDFTPVDANPEQGTILFGLSAVKNIGENAIQCILTERDGKGSFKSLADLCDRINLHTVNSRALEALIKCGALDGLNSNRKQSIEYMPLAIKWAQDRAKEQETGQLNLFDQLAVMTATSTFESAPVPPNIADFPVEEKLQFEKELLGFYVSEHPLKNAGRIAEQLGIALVSLGKLDEQKSRSKVSVLVMLTEIKQILTKKDERRMAFLQMEDIEGKAEAVVFPDTYEQVHELLIADTPILVSGKVDRKDDRTQVIVEEARVLKFEELKPVGNSVLPRITEMILLELTTSRINAPDVLDRLKVILEEHSADKTKATVPAIAIVIKPGTQYRAAAICGPNFWVQDCHNVVTALNSAGFPAVAYSLPPTNGTGNVPPFPDPTPFQYITVPYLNSIRSILQDIE